MEVFHGESIYGEKKEKDAMQPIDVADCIFTLKIISPSIHGTPNSVEVNLFFVDGAVYDDLPAKHTIWVNQSMWLRPVLFRSSRWSEDTMCTVFVLCENNVRYDFELLHKEYAPKELIPAHAGQMVMYVVLERNNETVKMYTKINMCIRDDLNNRPIVNIEGFIGDKVNRMIPIGQP